MRGRKFLFVLHYPMNSPSQNYVEQVPGVKASKKDYRTGLVQPGHTILTSFTAAPILQRMLEEAGIPFDKRAIDTNPLAELPREKLVRLPKDIPEIRGKIGDREFKLREYQEEGLVFFQERLGGLAHWPCGAGKTPLGICFALSDPQPPEYRKILIVTRSNTVEQWIEDEFKKFCNPGSVNCIALKGRYPFVARKSPPLKKEIRFLIKIDKESAVRELYKDKNLEGWVLLPGWRLRLRAAEVTPAKRRRLNLLCAKLEESLLPLTKKLPGGKTTLALAESLSIVEEVELDPLLLKPPEFDSLWNKLGDGGFPLRRMRELSKSGKSLLRKLYKRGCIEKKSITLDVPGWKPWQVIDTLSGEIVGWWDYGELMFPREVPSKLREDYRGGPDIPKARQVRAHIKIAILAGHMTPGAVLHAATTSLAAHGIKAKIDVESDIREPWGRMVAEKHAESLRGMSNLPGDLDVAVIGWDILKDRLPSLLSWGPTTLILDESHRGKSTKQIQVIQVGSRKKFLPRENATASARRLAEITPRCLLLTATPQPDRTRDWWAQLNNIDPFGFGSFGSASNIRGTFSGRYCEGHEGQWGYVSEGSSHLEELKERIGMFTHRVPVSRAREGLPKITRKLVTLSPDQLDKQPRLSRKAVVAARKQGATGTLELRIQFAAETKTSYILKRIEEAWENDLKVCVFTGRIQHCERLGKAVSKLVERLNKKRGKNRKAQVWWGHGGVAEDERRRMVKAYYSAPGSACFIGTIDAFGEAINGLQDTDLALIAVIPWTPGKVDQMEGRFPRSGSDRATLVEYIFAMGTVDVKMKKDLATKLESTLPTYDEAGELSEDIMNTLRGEFDEKASNERIAKSILKGLENESDMEDYLEDDEDADWDW